MKDTDKPNRVVKTADTVFGIIETIRELGGANLTTLADELGMANSTIHDHLKTLESKEYLVDLDGEYHLSLKFLDHGMFVQESREIFEHSRPKLQRIADETEEVVWLYVVEHGWLVVLESISGRHGVSTHGNVGTRSDFHAHAAGKVFLAHYDQHRVDELIDRHGLTPKTDQTITDRGVLMEELQAVQEQGYATNMDEIVDGIRGVSVPIIVEDEVVGALSVSGPSQRLKTDRIESELSDLLLAMANEIELSLQYE